MIRAAAALIAAFTAVTPAAASDILILPGPDAQERLQEALILAEPGQTIELTEGVFDLTDGLSLDNADVTIQGQGMGRTILSFTGQKTGAEGLLITADGAILKDFAVENAKGDAIKAKGVDGIAMIRVRAEWTGGPKAANGSYGLYPVQSKNVLIDGAVAIGASDAGIYVGQSEDIIVRNSRAEFNVAGLEIENSFRADVHDNVLTNNTGGLLVFDLPNLPQQGGHDIRFFRNESHGNNTENFAPAGNTVALVPAGTGMIVMGNDNVEIFDNDFHDNDTINVIVMSYFKKFEDPDFRPNPTRIHIHDNRFQPSARISGGGEMTQLLVKALNAPLPDVVWDGVMPLWDYFVWGQDREQRLSVHDNRHAPGARPYANAHLIMHEVAPFLHYPDFKGEDLAPSHPPVPPVSVTIRGMSADVAAGG